MSNSERSKMAINLDKVFCPKCDEKMPALLIPENIQQLMWGGWTCPKCDGKMDKFGKEIVE
jgi:Zn finger protein HypA/HybF involved in hydrogenase expression